MISVLIPVFNSQSVIIGFGSDDSDGHDDNDDDDGNYENLSGLEWFALQRTLMLNSTGFHTGFKLFLWTWNIVSCQSEILYHSHAQIGVQNMCTLWNWVSVFFLVPKSSIPLLLCVRAAELIKKTRTEVPPLLILTSRENPISFCQHTPQRITLFVRQRLTRTTIKYNDVFGDTFADSSLLSLCLCEYEIWKNLKGNSWILFVMIDLSPVHHPPLPKFSRPQDCQKGVTATPSPPDIKDIDQTC